MNHRLYDYKSHCQNQTRLNNQSYDFLFFILFLIVVLMATWVCSNLAGIEIVTANSGIEPEFKHGIYENILFKNMLIQQGIKSTAFQMDFDKIKLFFLNIFVLTIIHKIRSIINIVHFWDNFMYGIKLISVHEKM